MQSSTDGYTDIVEILLKHGANVEATGNVSEERDELN